MRRRLCDGNREKQIIKQIIGESGIERKAFLCYYKIRRMIQKPEEGK